MAWAKHKFMALTGFCQASALFALDSVVLLETGPGWLLKPRECKVNVVKDGRKNIVMVETISQIRRNCFTRAVGKNEYKHKKCLPWTLQ